MDYEGVEALWVIGKDLRHAKYFSLGMATIAVLDHLLTLDDEIHYVWKERKSWMFYAFLLNRYSLPVFVLWQQIAFQWPGYTQKMCDRSAWVEGIYLVFVFTLAQVFLAMRAYVLTAHKKLVLWAFSVLIATCIGMGLYMVFSPQTKAMKMLDIPLPAFHICVLNAPLWTEWVYVAGVGICDLATFACIIMFIRELRVTFGQERKLSHLVKTLIQDSTVYFFIMLTFNIAMLTYAVMARASLKNFPLVAPTVLVPVMVSRLVLSLRKAANEGQSVSWNESRPPVNRREGTNHEMMDLHLSSSYSSRAMRENTIT